MCEAFARLGPEIAFVPSADGHSPTGKATESGDDAAIWSAAAEQWERLERRDRAGHRHSIRTPSRVAASFNAPARSRPREREKTTTNGRQLWRASLVVTLAGTVLWLVPALTTHDPQPGMWEGLTAISPIWYVGLVAMVPWALRSDSVASSPRWFRDAVLRGGRYVHPGFRLRDAAQGKGRQADAAHAIRADAPPRRCAGEKLLRDSPGCSPGWLGSVS